MNARHTPLVAATWLIGLGLVFLVQRAAGWTWSEAWPLFVILVGAGGMAGTLAGDRRSTRGVRVLWALTWPVTWIVAGGALLAATTGQLPVSALDLLDRWWPLAALVLGVWFLVGAAVPVPDVPAERLALDLGARSNGP